MGYQIYDGSSNYIFISYARVDLNRGVSTDIQWMYEIGHNVWFDAAIGTGSKWSDVLARRIENCGCFCVFLSRSSVRSKHVLDEVQYALELDKPVMPICLDNVELPEILQPIQKIDRFSQSQRDYRNLLGPELGRDTLAIKAPAPWWPAGGVVDCTDAPLDTKIGKTTDRVWFLVIDTEAFGPMTTAQVGRRIESSRDCQLLVQQPGMEDWQHPDHLQVFR